MIAAMPLQLVLSENRVSHSRQGKGTHLKSSALVALHAVIDLSHLDGLIRLRTSFAIYSALKLWAGLSRVELRSF